MSYKATYCHPLYSLGALVEPVVVVVIKDGDKDGEGRIVAIFDLSEESRVQLVNPPVCPGINPVQLLKTGTWGGFQKMLRNATSREDFEVKVVEGKWRCYPNYILKYIRELQGKAFQRNRQIRNIREKPAPL